MSNAKNETTKTYEVKVGYIDKDTRADRNPGDVVRLTEARASEINAKVKGAVVEVKEESPKEAAKEGEKEAAKEGEKEAAKEGGNASK
jgi:hypothetical protein